MADFKTAAAEILKIEGGYSNNALDRGKETYKGISRRWNPDWVGWKIIDELKREPGFPKNLENHAKLQSSIWDLYKLKYWDPLKLDGIVSQEVARELFDISVNMDPQDAATIVQRSVNLLNKNQKLFPNLTVDGKIGDASAKVINSISDKKLLLQVINLFQGFQYISICEKDEKQEEFFIGWIKNRIQI